MTPTARPSRGYSFSSTASAIAAATATTFVQSTRVLSLIRWVANRWRWCSDDLAKTRHRFRCQREFGAMEPTGSSNTGPCEWSGWRRHDTIRRKTYPDVKKSLEEVHLGRGWGERRGTFAGEENIIGFLEYHSKYLVKSIRIVKRRWGERWNVDERLLDSYLKIHRR